MLTAGNAITEVNKPELLNLMGNYAINTQVTIIPAPTKCMQPIDTDTL